MGAADQEWTRPGLFLDRSEADRQTLGDLLDRYAREVSPAHKGDRNETICIHALARAPLCRHRASALIGKLLAEWRDRRLKKISGATVIREMNLRSAAINVARKEWGVHTDNPLTLIRRPAPGPAGTRRLLAHEQRKLVDALQVGGRRSDGTFEGGARNHWLEPLVQLALETAMRQGERLKLRWEDVNLAARTAYLHDTKNGEVRTVPLTTAAMQILTPLPHAITGRVFPVTAELPRLRCSQGVAAVEARACWGRPVYGGTADERPGH